MSTATLPITNVVTVSISNPLAGLADYQINNLAIFTKEAPVNMALTATNPGIYLSPAAVGVDWGASSEVYAQSIAIFSQTPCILDGGGSLVIFPIQSGDTLSTVIPAGLAVAQFGGALYAGYAPADAELEAAQPVAETNRVMVFGSQYQTSALTVSTGVWAIIAAASPAYSQFRKLLYTQAGTALGARLMAAAYAGTFMSVNFGGTNTAATMNLRQLTGITPDVGITQTFLTRCQAIGVDCYPTIAGRASVISSDGGNGFADNVYNENWLVFALGVAGFNALAEIGTKIPQTEAGVAILRGAYIDVLKQGVANGFLAPGQWNAPQPGFGNPAALLSNIAQQGWYIYSVPVALQSQTDRAARKAPLISIAVKFAGAIHSSNVVIFVNP